MFYEPICLELLHTVKIALVHVYVMYRSSSSISFYVYYIIAIKIGRRCVPDTAPLNHQQHQYHDDQLLKKLPKEINLIVNCRFRHIREHRSRPRQIIYLLEILSGNWCPIRRPIWGESDRLHRHCIDWPQINYHSAGRPG